MRQIVDTSLVFWMPLYKLDGGSLMSRDACGHGCTVIGAIRRGNSYYFDGLDDRIIVANHPAFAFGTGDFSLEIWFRADASGSGIQRLISKQAATWFFLRLLGNGTVGFSINDGATERNVAGTTNLRDDRWHHVVVTVDRDSATGLGIFLDGNEHAAASAIGVGDISNNVDINIGRYDGGLEYFRGNIGEIRIYNRLLAFPEVQRNYLATRQRFQ